LLLLLDLRIQASRENPSHTLHFLGVGDGIILKFEDVGHELGIHTFTLQTCANAHPERAALG
jgi:hypothetical protein